MLPNFLGGSADCLALNQTIYSSAEIFSKNNYQGRYIHFGVREFGMFAMALGLSSYCNLIPYVGTFLTFADYGKSSIRTAALMKKKVIYVLTHDSLGLGEDGPTHQPIEHLDMLRAMPKVQLWRPCDLAETFAAYFSAIHYSGPTAIALSRQGCKQFSRSFDQFHFLQQGYSVLKEGTGPVQLVIIASGSEVMLALDACAVLQEVNVKVGLHALFGYIFLSLTESEQESVLVGNSVPKLVIEAGSGQSWYKLIGSCGKVVSYNDFGFSAPGAQALYEAGYNVDNIVSISKQLLSSQK